MADENFALMAALGDGPRDAIFHEPPGDGGLRAPTFTEPVERILRDGAADGSLRAFEDPAETATVLFNLISWTYRHLRPATAGRPSGRARAAVDRRSRRSP